MPAVRVREGGAWVGGPGAGVLIPGPEGADGADGPPGTTDHGALTGLTDPDHPIGAVQGLQAALDTKASIATVDAETAARTAADATLVPLAQRGAANGVASLDAQGKVPAPQIPNYALSQFLGDVGSQAAMLALVGDPGDWCNRTDVSESFILIGQDPTQVGNWKQILTPASPVSSVNGRVGVVAGLAEQVTVDAEVTARAAGDTAGLQRINHQGQQPSSSISDLATVVKAYRLDEFAAPGFDVPFGGHRATTLADPVNPQDAATRAFVLAQIAALVASAPGVLDTLNELAAALGNDANFAATMTAALANKQPLDTDLTQIAGLASAADRFPYATGPGAWTLGTVTAAARALLDDADAPTMLATLAAVGTEDPRLLDAPLDRPLQQFRRAMATRGITPCDVCIIGDSITEGYYQGALDTSIWPQYTRTLLQRLNVAAGLSGGEGFIPARHVTTSPALEARWALSAGVDVSANPLYGLGLRSAILHPGDTATLIFTGTLLRVAYTQMAGAGTLHVVVDGGADVNVSAANATTKSGRLLDSAAVIDLPGGTHTAVVTATGGNVVLDGGFVCRADENAGVRVWPGGHSGYTAVHFADPTRLWDGILETVNMDLVVIFLGINDFNTGQTAAQLQANLITVGQRVKDMSAVDPSIVYVVPWPGSGTADATFRPFAAAVRAAARYHGAAVFDLWDTVGTPDGTNIWYDGSHPNIYGSLAISEAFVRQILGQEQTYPFDHANRHRTGGRDALVYEVRKAAIGAVVNNSNVLQDDGELFLDLPGNTTFELEAIIFHDGPTAADIKVGWSIPAGAAGRTVAAFSLAAATAALDATAALQQSCGTYALATAAATFTGTVTATVFRGTLRTTNPGRMRVRWAQNTATVGDTRVLDDSRLKLTVI